MVCVFHKKLKYLNNFFLVECDREKEKRTKNETQKGDFFKLPKKTLLKKKTLRESKRKIKTKN